MSLTENISAAFRECVSTRRALEDYDTVMIEIGGCSNHGCLINPPKGMGTNGPCKCLDDKHKARRAMTAARRLRNALEAANQ